MKKPVKLVAFLLSAVLLATLFSACGSSGKTEAAAEMKTETTAETVSEASESPVETITFRVSQSKSESHPYQMGIEMFASLVKEKYGDRFEFDIYPNSQLGNNTEVLEATQLGEIDIDVTDDGQLSNLVSDFTVLGLPFLFKDTDHVLRVVTGEIGEQLSASLESKGLVIICWLENGFRHVTNNRGPITTPNDLAGLKIRTPTSNMNVLTFNTLGAQATPIAANELFSALQLGTVEAQENSLANVIDQNLYEVQKYVSLTRHIHTTEPIVMSIESWNKLTEEEQQSFLEIGKQVSEWSYHYTESLEDSQLEKIAELGMEINTDIDLEAFRTAVEPIYEEYLEKYPELISAIKNG